MRKLTELKYDKIKILAVVTSSLLLGSFAWTATGASARGWRHRWFTTTTAPVVSTTTQQTTSTTQATTTTKPAPVTSTTNQSTTTTTKPAPTVTTTTVPAATCSGVKLVNGQADIDAHAAGTIYCMSGTHNWTLIPKTGDQIIGDGTAVLDGQNTTSWAIYVFDRDADNVVLSNFEIRNYKAESQRGAILSSNNEASTGWILKNLNVHDNGTVTGGGDGASLGPNWQVIGGRYYNNRQSGLAHGSSGVVVDGVELDHNNFTDDSYTAANIDCGFEAGGFKWAATSAITIENSKIHDNACRGLWADGSGNGAIVTNNTVYNNWADGIFIEISSHATVTNNTVYGNGFHTDGNTCVWLWGAGISLADSDSSEVAHNNVYGNCNGIVGLQQNRPDGNPGLLQNDNVHDNTIAGPTGRSGFAADNGANLATRNITWVNNTLTNGMTYCGFTC